MTAPSLADFLAQAARTPFAWGGKDCCLWPADWLVACGHPDPAADLRGRYRTALGAARILNKHGGVLGVYASRATTVGLRAVTTPIAGDIGVVMARDADGRAKPTGAICTGRRWAALGPERLIVAEMTPLAAWRI